MRTPNHPGKSDGAFRLVRNPTRAPANQLREYLERNRKLLFLSRVVGGVDVHCIERTLAVNVEDRLALGPLEVADFLV